MANPEPTIKLQSSDHVEITVGMLTVTTLARVRTLMCCTEKAVAERSILIKNMMEDIGDQTMNEAVPIPNVSCQHLML